MKGTVERRGCRGPYLVNFTVIMMYAIVVVVAG